MSDSASTNKQEYPKASGMKNAGVGPSTCRLLTLPSRSNAIGKPSNFWSTFVKFADFMVYGGLMAYFAGLLLLISFARYIFSPQFFQATGAWMRASFVFLFHSPYWIQSFDETFSSFKNMGLWEYCFDNFRYPYYQFDKLFSGCNWIFSQELYVIREWLLPGIENRSYKYLGKLIATEIFNLLITWNHF